MATTPKRTDTDDINPENIKKLKYNFKQTRQVMKNVDGVALIDYVFMLPGHMEGGCATNIEAQFSCSPETARQMYMEPENLENLITSQPGLSQKERLEYHETKLNLIQIQLRRQWKVQLQLWADLMDEVRGLKSMLKDDSNVGTPSKSPIQGIRDCTGMLHALTAFEGSKEKLESFGSTTFMDRARLIQNLNAVAVTVDVESPDLNFANAFNHFSGEKLQAHSAIRKPVFNVLF